MESSLKFTGHGAITLTGHAPSASPQNNGFPTTPVEQVRVGDTGQGIRSEDLRRLFRPFEQIDAGLARDHDDVGLSLAISQRLASLMGGRIDADSEWQRGSTFALMLPTAARPET